MSEPTIRIKDKPYPMPQNERLGELRLIEQVTGITHREFRTRAMQQLERLEAIEENDDLTVAQLLDTLDDIVTLARVAQAIQRANPRWSTSRVREFVDLLDEGDIVMESADQEEEDPGGPPADGAQDAPPSPTGTTSAPPSSSDSDTGLSESTTPPTSGTATSPTPPAEPSAQTT